MKRTDAMRKDVPPIPWVNLLTLLILVSAPAGKLQAASYEVVPSGGLVIGYDGTLYGGGTTSVDVVKLTFAEVRGMYSFRLPPMDGTIVSAQWQFIPIVDAVGFFGFSTFSLYDVGPDESSSVSAEETFNDLGSGKLYGRRDIFEADNLNLLTMPLSADAIDDLNVSKDGTNSFHVGCAVASGSIDLSSRDDGIWSRLPTLILETEAAPEPVVLSGLDLAGDTLTVTIRNIPDGQTVHLRQSTDLVTFEPLSPPLNITGTDSPQTLPITLGATPRARLFLRVYEGASPQP